jgi:hypothetical protein
VDLILPDEALSSGFITIQGSVRSIHKAHSHRLSLHADVQHGPKGGILSVGICSTVSIESRLNESPHQTKIQNSIAHRGADDDAIKTTSKKATPGASPTATTVHKSCGLANLPLRLVLRARSRSNNNLGIYSTTRRSTAERRTISCSLSSNDFFFLVQRPDQY